MKKIQKLLVIVLVVVMTVTLLSGCGKKYKKLDKGITGDITVMVWSGSGAYLEDVGHKDLTPADLTGQNEAAIYAMAKEFNKTYPNIKINVFAKTGGPNDNETPWNQEIENFKAEHGKYPDIWASTDLVGDVSRGLVADLTVFKEDPMYKSFNKTVMETMNYYGFQAGLPQFMQPWGVYVNKELAEQNNIDIPPVDWNIDEYTAFATSGDNKKFWGAMDIPMGFINTGSKSINYALSNYSGEGDHLNLNAEDVTALLEYVPKWSKSAVWPQWDAGAIPQEIMDSNGWWSFNFFINNYVLTLDGDPWMMGDAANPTEGHWAAAKSNDWDIYPRPSTDYQPNTVGMVVDPMAIHNYAMDDGNPEWSEEEQQKLKVAYTFASYWAGSTDAMRARAEQTFIDQGVEKTSINDSLPLVTGKAFDEQMEVWYSTPAHARFKDATKMPGFQKVLEIWESGQMWDISDKTYPYYITEDGSQKVNLHEWQNYYNVELSGAYRTAPNWLDQIKAKLPDWNEKINARFAESENQLVEGLKTYYGFTDEDFKVKEKK